MILCRNLSRGCFNYDLSNVGKKQRFLRQFYDRFPIRSKLRSTKDPATVLKNVYYKIRIFSQFRPRCLHKNSKNKGTDFLNKGKSFSRKVVKV